MKLCLFAALVIVLLTFASFCPAIAATSSPQEQLSAHWVPGWGFRDELNPNDVDYQNFWTDNAGKILTTGLLADDPADAGRALSFIQDHMTSWHYLPEVLVNSSIVLPKEAGGSEVSNRIVELNTSAASTGLEALSIGDYYAGGWNAGYVGADRIWYGGSAHGANSSTVITLPDGYVKRSYFSFGGLSFYTFLNATLAPGAPYVRVSLQILPLNSAFGPGDHVDLQVFSGASAGLAKYAFENVAMFDSGGNVVGVAPFDNATAPGESSMLVAYSNRTSPLTEDSVALRYNSTSVSSVEHWYMDGAFDGLSWVGLGYDVSEAQEGTMSSPVYADVYPIQHMDFHLLSDMARYIFTDPVDVAVSPPVSFGFVAWGLAVAGCTNVTARALAQGYWDLYYARYEGTEADLAYARSISLTALAGFELYGGNATVEGFTRHFLETYQGSAIEEFGWDAAALQTLYQYSGSAADLSALQKVEGSFVPGGRLYLGLDIQNPEQPGSTFNYAEAASGMLEGGVPYNSPDVIWAMNAVFASNSSGVLLNSPRHGDLANTETIPAYVLAEWLFQNAMRNATGYWITSLHDVNITSISYVDETLSIRVVGNNGSLCLGTSSGAVTRNDVNGEETLQYGSLNAVWYWALLLGAIITVGVVVLIVVWRSKRRPGPDK